MRFLGLLQKTCQNFFMFACLKDNFDDIHYPSFHAIEVCRYQYMVHVKCFRRAEAAAPAERCGASNDAIAHKCYPCRLVAFVMIVRRRVTPSLWRTEAFASRDQDYPQLANRCSSSHHISETQPASQIVQTSLLHHHTSTTASIHIRP
jgi:hypothetical protein